MLPLTTLTTRGLILRPHVMADLPGVTRFFTDEMYTRYMLIPMEMRSPDGAKQGLEYLIQSYESPQPIFALAVTDLNSGEFFGFCQLWPTGETQTVELVYAILPDRQGLGIATRAAKAVTEFALTQPNVNEVVAFVIAENVASVRVVEKMGFINDGPAIHHGRPAIRFRATKIQT